MRALQFTLVDCPGHASLIKTLLVGAQIMDVAVLVVDATKGIQAQTAECIILAELLSERAIVALNKIDLFPEATRMKQTRKAGRAVLEALKLTKLADSELCPVSAAKGQAVGIDDLKTALLNNVPTIVRDGEAPFLFMSDHCFHVKGQGTVLSGAGARLQRVHSSQGYSLAGS